MKWVDILKETITQGRVKEIEDIDIDIEDDDCNRKLQRMYNKLKNYNLLLEERWKAGWPRYAEYFAGVKHKTNNETNSFGIYIDEEQSDMYSFPVFTESTIFIYNPVPEPVACKALEILESHQKTHSDGGGSQNIKTYYFEHDGVTWEILRSFNFDYQDNNNSLAIGKEGEDQNNPQIWLECGKTENLSLVSMIKTEA